MLKITARGGESPRLSIGIPVYNGEKFIAGVLDCFSAQTFADFELVVCDNASSDDTFAIAQAHAARDGRFRAFRNDQNLGAVPNFNRVLTLSSATPLFKWAAADDLCDPTYLETCMQLLATHPDAVLAHTNARFIDETGAGFAVEPETGNYIDPMTGALQRADSPSIGDSPLALQRYWQVLSQARWGTHMFGVVPRAALLKTGLVGNFPSGDRSFLCELALLGRFKASPERLFAKRFHQRVSWAMSDADLKGYIDTANQRYSPRYRQLKAYLEGSSGKALDPASRAACAMMVIGHGVKVGLGVLAGKRAAEAAQGARWRQINGTAS